MYLVGVFRCYDKKSKQPTILALHKLEGCCQRAAKGASAMRSLFLMASKPPITYKSCLATPPATMLKLGVSI